MKQHILKYRERAKIIVFSNFFGVIVASFLSQIASTLILNYFFFSASNKNVDLASGKPEMLYIMATVTFLAIISSLPLVASLNRYYLSLSQTLPAERLPLRKFFTLFTTPKVLLKCSVAVLVTNVIYIISTVFVLPVFFVFCLTLFVILDNPDTSVFKALSLSRRLMKKKKMMAFKASLPFLILSLVSAGISANLPMLSVIISALSEAMFYVTLALIYNDAKTDLS